MVPMLDAQVALIKRMPPPCDITGRDDIGPAFDGSRGVTGDGLTYPRYRDCRVSAVSAGRRQGARKNKSARSAMRSDSAPGRNR
jgi:hypothetical protein